MFSQWVLLRFWLDLALYMLYLSYRSISFVSFLISLAYRAASFIKVVNWQVYTCDFIQLDLFVILWESDRNIVCANTTGQRNYYEK